MSTSIVRALLAAGAALVAASALAGGAAAADAPPGPSASEKAFEKSLAYRTGTIAVRDARITLPAGYRYLASADAQRTLTDLYGNPPHPEVEALILPPRATVLDNPYFVVVTYEDDGHVDDADAAAIDFDEMLRQMQADDEKTNAERAKDGYEPIELVGWADQPHYEPATHKLYWALDLRFGGATERTLNYEVRTLGREGMLALNAVSSIEALADVRKGMQAVLGVSSFSEGRRYEDYQEGDRRSELTVAAVVAGGAYAVAKTGLIAVLLAKAKFLLFGLVGVVGAVMRRLRKGTDEPTA